MLYIAGKPIGKLSKNNKYKAFSDLIDVIKGKALFEEKLTLINERFPEFSDKLEEIDDANIKLFNISIHYEILC